MPFKIKCGDLTICNSEISESMVINPIVILEANKAGSFSFVLPPTHSFYDIAMNRRTVITAERDEEIVFRGFVTLVREDFLKNRYITCEGELSYLNDSILRQKKYTNQNVLSLLTAYINEHNSQVDEYKRFEVGQVTVSSTDSILRYTNMQSTMTEINEDLLDNYGGYIRVRYEGEHRYIDYLKDSPRFCNQTIELGKNLVDYKSNLDESSICTVVIPQGTRLETPEVEGLDAYLTIKPVNEGKDYIEASADVIDTYGRIARVVTWDDVTVSSILKRKAEDYLKDAQFANIVIECSAVDLGAFSDRVDTFKLLDTIHVKSEAHGMDKDFVLTKINMNLAEPYNDIFTFGKSEKMTMTATTNKKVAEAFKKIPVVSSVLEQAQQNASNIIAGAEGGYVLIDTDINNQPNRILIMDNSNKDLAMNVIQINKNGIGFSNSGVDGFYRNAWTIDGQLVADFITTGVLQGVEVRADRGRFGEWNLATYGTDVGSLYADTGDYRVWMHTAGYSNDSANIPLYVWSLQKKNAEGNYDTYFYVDTEGAIFTTGRIYSTDDVSAEKSINSYGTLAIAKKASFFDEVEVSKGIIAEGRVYGVTGVTAGGKVFNNAFSLWVVGNAYATSSFISGSDRQLKNSIEDIDENESINFIKALNPVRYKMNDGNSGRYHHGLIAQNVKEAMGDKDWGVFCQLKDENGEDLFAGLRYEELIADLIGSIKLLSKKIEKLESDIESLKGGQE